MRALSFIEGHGWRSAAGPAFRGRYAVRTRPIQCGRSDRWLGDHRERLRRMGRWQLPHALRSVARAAEHAALFDELPGTGGIAPPDGPELLSLRIVVRNEKVFDRRQQSRVQVR